jgi:hypothetical protein
MVQHRAVPDKRTCTIGDVLRGLLFAEGHALVVPSPHGDEAPSVLGEYSMSILSQTFACYAQAEGDEMLLRPEGWAAMIEQSNGEHQLVIIPGFAHMACMEPPRQLHNER